MPAQKTVSQLDAQGVYLGIAVADESPLEPGVWLLPGSCVDASPPVFDPATHLARWDGAAFVLEALPPPAPEPEPPTLSERRAATWERIKSYRDQRKAAGVLVGTHWFHSDDSSRIQQLGLTMMGANMPPGIMWKTMGGAFVAMTPTLAGQIFQASAASDQAIFAVAEQHKAAMEAAEIPEAYDFMIGWPPVFGEV